MNFKKQVEEYFEKLTKNYGYEMGLYNAIIELTKEEIQYIKSIKVNN